MKKENSADIGEHRAEVLQQGEFGQIHMYHGVIAAQRTGKTRYKPDCQPPDIAEGEGLSGSPLDKSRGDQPDEAADEELLPQGDFSGVFCAGVSHGHKKHSRQENI